MMGYLDVLGRFLRLFYQVTHGVSGWKTCDAVECGEIVMNAM